MSNREADFEAEVRFIPTDEGGRQGPVVQGYRADIQYDDLEGCWMVWPLFLDEKGTELAKGIIVPNISNANFYIINDKLRNTVHREKLQVGIRFYICEGQRRVAECQVVKILNLYQDFDES